MSVTIRLNLGLALGLILCVFSIAVIFGAHVAPSLVMAAGITQTNAAIVWLIFGSSMSAMALYKQINT
jgi:hypothetical protein